MLTFFKVAHFCPISVFSRIEFELQPYEHFIAKSKLFDLSTITDKLIGVASTLQLGGAHIVKDEMQVEDQLSMLNWGVLP